MGFCTICWCELDHHLLTRICEFSSEDGAGTKFLVKCVLNLARISVEFTGVSERRENTFDGSRIREERVLREVEMVW